MQTIVAAPEGDLGPVDTGLTAEDGQRYAEALVQLNAFQAALDARLAELVKADPDARELQDRREEALGTIQRFQAAIAQVVSDADRARAGTVRARIGPVAVTWPAPARRWTMAARLEDIAEDKPELAELLGIQQVTSKPAPPRLEIKP